MNIKYFIKNPKQIAIPLVTHYLGWLPDRLYLSLLYRAVMGKKLNLKSPKLFTEKIQWLKLYDRNPEYTKMVDKYAVKDYVKAIIGEEYIIPTLGVWSRPEDIQWDILPDCFVLKTTHGGGSSGVVICKDKTTFDKQAAIDKLKAAMDIDIYKIVREWPYKNVPKRIIAEEYIDPTPKTNDLPDYKWYCFNGEPKFCQVIQNRTTEETIDFFDVKWNHQEFVGLNPNAGPALNQPKKPENLDLQLRIACQLSKDIPFSRIDLYETDNNTFFGEVTFYPASGFGKFSPAQYKELLGQMINMPGEKRGKVIISQLHNDRISVTVPDLPDYKFFCFNGKVKMMFVATERQNPNDDVKFDFFDADYNHLPFKQGHENSEVTPAKPQSFELMKTLAEKLSSGIPQVRVDFYEVNKHPMFGEMTFYHFSGLKPIDPESWDEAIGKLLDLNNLKKRIQ